MSERRIRPAFLWALGSVVVLLVALIAAINIWGNEFGEPCADSYSCKGFLLGGAECVDVGSEAYCTRYCDDDADCPIGTSCQSATPTVLTVESSISDEVCVLP